MTNSPTIVCITPMFPLRKPPKALPKRANQIFEEKPTMIIESMVPAHPASKTGLRPILSDRPPQYMPVRDSASAKAEMRRPA